MQPTGPILPLRAWTSARWGITLPPTHRFPIEKYALIRDAVIRRGILPPDAVLEPDRVEPWALRLVHTQRFIDSVMNGTMTPDETRRLGFPWGEDLRERSLRTVQGTLEASRDALDRGAGITLAGGTHHAFADHGEGFCVFNDVAIAIRVLQREGRIVRALIIDLDVHQGNGTANLFSLDEDIFTFSMHGAKNYPFHKERSTLDIELEDGCSDSTYLALLEQQLGPAFDGARPDIVFYLAGSDPYVHDRFGRLGLTLDGLRTRDQVVVEGCRRRGHPLVLTMAGGYARDLADIAFIHSESVRVVVDTFGPSVGPHPGSLRRTELL
ncbi:MAG: histone deacetylase [Gemmatimonadota bacterium]